MAAVPALWNGVLSFGAAFSTEINSLAAGNTAISSVVLDNTSALNTDGWISWSISGAATAGQSSLTFYLLPLNQDDTTYGDNIASGAAAPDAQYQVGTAQVQPASSGDITGSLYIGAIPPAKFKLAVSNGTGNAFGASGNTISFASNSINLNG